MDQFKQIANKLRPVEREVVREEGSFVLFALMKPEEGFGRYYLILSAPWLDRSDRIPWRNPSLLPKMKYFTERIVKLLSDEELVMLSGILLFKPDLKIVQATSQFVGEVNEIPKEMGRHVFAGIEFRRGIVLASHPTLLQEAYTL